jgi:hypothetical protein
MACFEIVSNYYRAVTRARPPQLAVNCIALADIDLDAKSKAADLVRFPAEAGPHHDLVRVDPANIVGAT